jgi:hypothetical protein
MNTNTAISRQLMRTARKLEAEWRSAGKREYVGKGRWVKYWAHLDRWISTWRAFWNLWTIYFFNFPKYGGPRLTAVTESAIWGHTCSQFLLWKCCDFLRWCSNSRIASCVNVADSSDFNIVTIYSTLGTRCVSLGIGFIASYQSSLSGAVA